MYAVSDKIITFLPWDKIEKEAQQQIINTSELPVICKHGVVMPDCHYGKGATVGTVLATKVAVVPAAVGVDIGCGMIAVRTSLKRNDIKNLSAIRAGLERRIPMSAGNANKAITESARERINELEKTSPEDLKFYNSHSSWQKQLGTLGGGNHFVELCTDENNTIWATLHSGSRGIGNKIGSYYIKTAQKLMEKFHIQLPDRDLAYLPEDTSEFDDYVRHLHWAQKFALLNREEMMD